MNRDWMIACLIMAAVFVAENLFIVFYGLPRAARLWQWEGYWLGRRDEQDGAPVPARMPPPRTEEL